MHIITNRAMDESKKGVKQFLSTSGQAGSLDLRIVKISGPKKARKVDVLQDELSLSRVKFLKKKYNLDIDTSVDHYQSLELACQLFERATKEKKHITLFVHGYNNDVEDIIATVNSLNRTYKDTIFVPFSWPAKGGGKLSGTANYIEDKRDARASSGALDRVFKIVRDMHKLLTEGQSKTLWKIATEKHSDNAVAARELFVRLQRRQCKVTINLMCHSMGNYVLKHATLPSLTNIRKVTFDNVCLIAADTNHDDHGSWIPKIEAKGGVYVVINEDDYALKWARIKPGEEQKRRLGHYLNNLDALNTTYIDVTRATGVGEQHSYFIGRKLIENKKLAGMFGKIFAGDRPERLTSLMQYMSDLNAYRLR
ncbi:MAG: alpha/beta hydrolase [Pseudomonadota bacterium]